ncbi:MAG: ABC transporter permease [Spirochaetia bacterium]|nr:ABC transporter permease [Spirochaetia bacterium]
MRYLLSRFYAFLLLIFTLVLIGISLQSLRGGSAASIITGQRASEKDIQKLDEKYASDKNIVFQAIDMISKYIRFDFGETIKGEPVFKLINESFRNTFVLAILAAAFALIYGIVFGLFSHAKEKYRTAIVAVNYIVLANPIFILSLILLWVFSLFLSWLPPGGALLNGWYILPAAALGLKAGCRLALFTDEFTGREKKNQYVTTAKAYGFSNAKIYFIFILKNILLPLLSFWLLDFASYLAGAAIVETIFSVPGIGRLLLRALMQYDLNLIMGILVFVSVLVFLVGTVQEGIDRYTAKFSQTNG